MNPNMMGMQALPNVPTTKELWKNEKDKYRLWIVMFAITLTAITALAIVTFILGLVNSGSIEHDIRASLSGNQPDKITDPVKIHDWENEVTNSFLVGKFKVFPGIIAGLLLIGLVMYVVTLVDAYKRKSFSKISKWTTLVISIGTFYGIYMLVSMAWQHGSVLFDVKPEGIIVFMLYVSSILVFIGGSMQVSRIRKKFAISERVEQIKASPQYQAMKAQMDQYQANGQGPMMNPMGGMGPMGPVSTPQPATPSTPANAGQTVVGEKPTVVQPAVKRELSPLEKQTKKLSAMKMDDLKSLAKKLSISGYSTMKKTELVNNIIRITGGK